MSLNLFQELMKGLAEETECYRRLLVLARQQKEILVSAKIEELPPNVRFEEKQVFLLGPLVARRNELLARIAEESGLKKMDLTEAMVAAPGEISDSFKETALKLAETAKELEAVNQGNDKLLKNALSYVNFTLKAISAGGRPSAVQMNKASEKPAPSFVNRTV
jgi:hypothetical protein